MPDLMDFHSKVLSVRIEPVQQRSAERVTSLLDAAAALIDEHGINGLTTSEVASRSGSSVGVVYRYYPNIQSLLRALASRNMDRFTARVLVIMSDKPGRWLNALDNTIDAYVELNRTEPGFRLLGFGDVIDNRFIEPDRSNNGVLAAAFTELLTTHYGVTASPELTFDIEVIIEVADAMLKRAFLYDTNGDDRFISRLRILAVDLMGKHDTDGTA